MYAFKLYLTLHLLTFDIYIYISSPFKRYSVHLSQLLLSFAIVYLPISLNSMPGQATLGAGSLYAKMPDTDPEPPAAPPFVLALNSLPLQRF